MLSLLVLTMDPALSRGLEEARGGGVDVEVVSDVAALFAGLAERPRTATFVSRSVPHVDVALVERLAAEPTVGALLLSSPAATLEGALLAERVGARASLIEPVEPRELVERLATVADEGPTVDFPDVGDLPGTTTIVGESPAMAPVFALVARAAPSPSTVLVTGESGTGKELVARALHEHGERPDGPFVAINCAAIPETLLESELFGHEKGAFTGAVARRAGRFEQAHGGTLFLDEIGDMSPVLQAKVLRALEERAVERVGGSESRPVDVRVVAATHTDLRAAIEAGRFREDLYYRLAVVEIGLPPLRERRGDVRLLALHFGARFARVHRRPVRAITGEALRRLEAESWPGNVRELRNVMDRAVLLSSGGVVRAGALRLGRAAPRASAGAGADVPSGYPASTPLARVEADHIARVLADRGGQIGAAAEVLGIHRNTLARKIREYGIDPGRGGQTP